MNWQDIKGHDDNVHILKTMLATGRMPHALLFTGPKGIGKRTLAKITAKAILCSGEGEKPCGSCESCKLMERSAHPDLIVKNSEGNSIKN
jgi:DNA polymerase-3 subunit delta'